MSWIESHEEIGDHHKTHMLCEVLDCDIPTAVGLLHLLWHYTLRIAWQDGDLSKQPYTAIARACWWKCNAVGNAPVTQSQKNEEKCNAETLIKAFQKAGFMDGMIVHGWEDLTLNFKLLKYQQEHRKSLTRERVRRFREGKNIPEKCNAVGNAPVTQCNATTIPNLTKPYKQQPRKPAATTAGTPQAVLMTWFLRTYQKVSGSTYHTTQADFVLLAKLIKIHTKEKVGEKLTMLFDGCVEKTLWFAKDSGVRAITIKSLSLHWNEIPDMVDATEKSTSKLPYDGFKDDPYFAARA